MDRIYTQILKKHLVTYPQMAFLVGPRQVGKTTIATQLATQFNESIYLNWDVIETREKILSGQKFIEDIFPLNVMRSQKPLIIFDEIHKYKNWKNYLKGFFDVYKNNYSILVTGSARLDIYQAGGDSLMGRYFQYTVHPLTLSEVLSKQKVQKDTEFFQSPSNDKEMLLERLFQFGGFPDPFVHKAPEYSNLWQSTRLKQLIFEDIQSVAQIHDIQIIEVLAKMLKYQTGGLLNKSNLAKKIQVTVQTVSRWIDTLERLYYCFRIKPFHANVTRSLIKEPKIFLWDWSQVEEEGARFENMMAVSLLKFVNFWTEQGIARFDLYYLRDIDKKEVDFVVTKNNTPYLMVEAKLSSTTISPHISHFQKQINPIWSLQSVYNMNYIPQSCFKEDKQIYVVPARTLLSQLI
jgi:predicted AAA+ superfamily ATPase